MRLQNTVAFQISELGWTLMVDFELITVPATSLKFPVNRLDFSFDIDRIKQDLLL